MATRNFEFNWEFRNFAIRTIRHDYKDKNSPIKKNHPIELIKYFDETHKSCYVVAYFSLDEEGYELHFVGGRPMRDIEPEEMRSIWTQLQAAQKMLDAFFEACETERMLDEYGE